MGRLVSVLLRNTANRFEKRNRRMRGISIASAASPLSLAFITTGISVGLATLVLPAELILFRDRVILLLYTVAMTWFIYNLVDLLELWLMRLASRTSSQLDDQIVPLVSRTARLFFLVIFVLFTAQNVFGADITAWLAGLGIAGLAVSLAAQDSIKNLFGSITIFMDRAFAVGDRIVFDGNDGTVEEIGFRSTKIRTLDGSLVTIPNAKIVDGSVINIQRRLNLRRCMDITITYDTPTEKIEQAVKLVKDILADPEIAGAFDLEKFPPRVSFNELNADSLNIRVFYWHRPPDYWQYLEHAQKFNLKLMRAFEQAGIEFAFPTRTLYLAGDPKRQLTVELSKPGPDR